jgi:hypothetical protein
MDPRQILKAAKNGIVGNTPQEIAMLDSLVSDGYLKREDREPPLSDSSSDLPDHCFGFGDVGGTGI